MELQQQATQNEGNVSYVVAGLDLSGKPLPFPYTGNYCIVGFDNACEAAIEILETHPTAGSAFIMNMHGEIVGFCDDKLCPELAELDEAV